MPDTFPAEQPPLTQEQLDFFSTQTAEAVKKSNKRVLRSAFAGYLILLVGVFGMYENGQSVSGNERQAVVDSGTVISVDGCNRDFQDREVLRAQIEKGKKTTLQYVKDGTLTQKQADRAIRETDEFLKSYPSIDCRPAAKILTDNPDDVTRIPEPMYPGKDPEPQATAYTYSPRDPRGR